MNTNCSCPTIAKRANGKHHPHCGLTCMEGWYGAVAILLGYFLVSFEIITSQSTIYQLLNLTGALGIILVSLSKRAYQPAVLNIFWLLIALVALGKIFLG